LGNIFWSWLTLLNSLVSLQVMFENNQSRDDEEDGAAISAGCVLWTDADGVRWCKDIHGKFGDAGALSQLYSDAWHAVAEFPSADPDADGCVYWTDGAGVRWCRDVHGAWGPPGGQYHSRDGGEWFGDGDAWLTLSDEAADFFAAAASRRSRQSGAYGRRGAAGPGSWRGQTGGEGAGADGGEAGVAASAAVAAAAELYGEHAQAVAALEAAADAAFDAACRAARPVLWPELPLRL
jgi:hypothetical protein